MLKPEVTAIESSGTTAGSFKMRCSAAPVVILLLVPACNIEMPALGTRSPDFLLLEPSQAGRKTLCALQLIRKGS